MTASKIKFQRSLSIRRDLIPDTTPGGLVIDQGAKDDFMHQIELEDSSGDCIELRATGNNCKHKNLLAETTL